MKNDKNLKVIVKIQNPSHNMTLDYLEWIRDWEVWCPNQSNHKVVQKDSFKNCHRLIDFLVSILNWCKVLENLCLTVKLCPFCQIQFVLYRNWSEGYHATFQNRHFAIIGLCYSAGSKEGLAQHTDSANWEYMVSWFAKKDQQIILPF